MEMKHLWRTLIHKSRSNKIYVIAGIFITIFLWNTMTTGKEYVKNGAVVKNENKEERTVSKKSVNEGRPRDLEHEEKVRIDIRGINSKLETINKLNSNSKNKAQLYSLTNIDPDIEKGERAQALVGEAFHVLDNFINTNNSETYKGMKSMFQMWNPKSSKAIFSCFQCS